MATDLVGIKMLTDRTVKLVNGGMVTTTTQIVPRTGTRRPRL